MVYIINLTYSLSCRNSCGYFEVSSSNLRKFISIEINSINVYNLIILTCELWNLHVDNSVAKDIVTMHEVSTCNSCVTRQTCHSSILVVCICLILEEDIAYKTA